MKIVCERDKFLAAFQSAASVAPSRSPKPILQNVKLDASEQETLLMATDLEVGVRVEATGVDVQEPGRAVLPAARVARFLRECLDEKIVVETSGQGVRVSGAHSNVQLAAEDPDEFPTIGRFSATAHHEMSARLFRELARRTLFATDTESSRYALGGVCLELGADKVIAVATDGRRLAKMEGPARSVSDAAAGGALVGEAAPIVPTRSMQLIERAVADAEGDIRLALRDNDLAVQAGRTTLFTRLVEGRFPKWREAIPQSRESVRVELTVGPVLSALQQAAVVTDEESRGVDFTFGEGSLVLSALTAETGSSRVELPIAYDGPPVMVTLDHRFVAEFLRVLDADKTFTADVQDGESAAVFSTDDSYVYVVMPLARER